VVGNMTSAGTVEVNQIGTTYADPVSLVIDPGNTFTSSGTMDVGVGAGASGSGALQQITGSVVNTGTAEVMNGTLELVSPTSWDNQGSLTVDTNANAPTLQVDPGVTFLNDTGGSVVNNGTTTSAGALTQGNGTESGHPVLVSGGTIAFSGTGSPAAYDAEPGSPISISGNIDAGVTLSINSCAGYPSCTPYAGSTIVYGHAPTTVTVIGNMTSAGTVELNMIGATYPHPASLVIDPGDTFTSSGTVNVGDDPGVTDAIALQLLAGNLVNQGVMDVQRGTLTVDGSGLSTPPGAVVNDGTVTVEAGASIGIAGGAVFTNGDGADHGGASLSVLGTFADGGTFGTGDGTISGQPISAGGGGLLDLTGTGNTGHFVIPRGTSAFALGSLAPLQSLQLGDLSAPYCGVSATLQTEGNFVNNGTINLDSQDSSCQSTFTLPVGDTLTNGPTGVLQILGTNNGNSFDNINGSLDNAGTVVVNGADFTMGSGGSTTNSGLIEVENEHFIAIHLTNSGVLTIGATAQVLAQQFVQSPQGDLTVDVINGGSGGVLTIGGSTGNAIAGTLTPHYVGTGTPTNNWNIVTWGGCTGSCTFGHLANGIFSSTQIFTATSSSSGVLLSLVPGSANNVVASNVNITSGSSANPDDTITGTYFLTNEGSGVTGNDSIYLGTTPIYEPGDALITQNIYGTSFSLPGGSGATENFSGIVPPVHQPGPYYVIVVPDSTDEVSAGLTGGQAASPSTIDIGAIPSLTPGLTTITPGVVLADTLYYQLHVTSSDVTLSGVPTGSNSGINSQFDGIYAAQNRIPTRGDYDLGVEANSTDGAHLTIPASNPGTWYILVVPLGNGFSQATNPAQTISLTPTLIGFGVGNPFPSSAENTGFTAIGITGSDFGSDLQISLVGPITINGTSVTVKSTRAATAIFDLANVPTGSYTVSVTSHGLHATGGTFSVSSQPPAVFSECGFPSNGPIVVTTGSIGSLRYGWVGTVNISFMNIGAYSVDVPAVHVLGDSALVAAPGSTNFEPEVDIVNPAFQNVEILNSNLFAFAKGALQARDAASIAASESAAPNGVLQPGESASLTIEVKSTTTVPHAVVGFDTSVTASAAVLGQFPPPPAFFTSGGGGAIATFSYFCPFGEQYSWGYQPPAAQPINWTTQLATDQPSDISNASWATIVSQVAKDMGPDTYTYGKNLEEFILAEQSSGLAFANEGAALRSEVEKAIDTTPGAPVSGTLYLGDTSHSLGQTNLQLAATNESGTNFTATSWNNGQFSFWDVPPGEYSIVVNGYTPHPAQTVNVNPTATGLSVVVQHGATMVGTVTTATGGNPVSGAIVEVTDTGGTVDSAPTGSDGTFAVSGIEPGPVSATARGPALLASSPVTATAALSAPIVENFVLAQGATITGQITVTGGAVPPTGTTVSAVPDDQSGPPVPGTVNAGGSYSIDGLPPEAGPSPNTYTVIASATGVGVASQSGITVTGVNIRSGIDLVLSQGAKVSGVVTDADSGNPIAGVNVVSDGIGAFGSVLTNSLGQYTLNDLPTGPQDLTFVPADSTYLGTEVSVDPTSDSVPVRLDQPLIPAGTATVSVKTGDGIALSGQPTVLEGPAPTGASANATTSEDASTNTSGIETFTGLLPGSYDVQVVGTSVDQSFTIGSGSRSPSLNLVVPVAVVQGTVTDNSGNPLAGVDVAAVDATRAIATTTTATDGTYSLYLSTSGTFDLTASAANFGAAVAPGNPVTVGSTTTVNFQAGSASLTVTATAAGNPLNGATLSVSTGTGHDQTDPVLGQTGANGQATIAPLAPGTYSVSVSASGDAASTQSFIVSPGSNFLAVPLVSQGIISGTVTDGSGPVSGATVRVISGTFTAETSTAAGGIYTIAGLPAGTYDASFSDATDAPATSNGIVVTAGATATASPTLSSAGSTVALQELADSSGAFPPLVLSVLDPNGATVASTDLGPALSSSSLSATATLGPLASGSYTLSVSGQGLATTSQSLTMPSGTITVTPPNAEAIIGSASTGLVPAAKRSASTSHSVSVTPYSKLSSFLLPKSIFNSALIQSWLLNNAPNPKRQDADNDALLARVSAAVSQSIPDCAGPNNIRQLQANLSNLYQAMLNSFGAWESAYSAVNAVNNANLFNLLADISITAGDLSGAVLSAISPAGQLASWATNIKNIGNLPSKGFVTGLNLITSGAYSYSNISSEFLSGDPAAAANSAAGLLNNFGNLASTLTLIKKIPGLGGQILGAVGGLAQAIGQIITYLQDIKQSETDAANIIGPVIVSQNTYLTALKKVYAALAAVNAAFANLQTQQNCPPPPPPTPPPAQPVNTTTGTNIIGHDPNEITGTTGTGAPHFITDQTPLNYQIEFANSPLASGAVVEVHVSEPVSPNVDPSTVQLTGFGFGHTSLSIPPGKQTFSETVPSGDPQGDNEVVTGSYDQSSNTINWTFSTVNPATGDLDFDASAGFLPPDNANGDGEGFVSYTAAPLSTDAPGTVIPAQASITFDRNAPISTPVWSNEIEGAPEAQMSSLAATTPAGPLHVTWAGLDAAGPGITGYNVFVSVNGGQPALWQSHTSNTSGTYTTTAGNTYAFSVDAADAGGQMGAFSPPVQTQAINTTTTTTTTPSSGPGPGYWLVGSDGGVFTFGTAPFQGSAGNIHLNQPIEGMAATPDSGGYWLVASDGGVFSYGDARFHGSTGNIVLNKPIVGMAATPDGGGYWLVASDGGVFSFGDATFHGSTGAIHLNKPIVGMAPTSDGGGYWLVASDGGIFTFGDARFLGSMGSQTLNKPIVGMAPTSDGGGYWLVASDGGIFNFGDAHFYGSTGGRTINKPIVAVAPTNDGAGYWLVASDGGVFSFGDAPFRGSAGGTHLNGPIVGLAPMLTTSQLGALNRRSRAGSHRSHP
jgi:hypothetical protein